MLLLSLKFSVGDVCWNIANYVAAIVKEDGCHCQRRWLSCESQRGLLVQHLQPLDIVKEGGYNGGLLVAAPLYFCWRASFVTKHKFFGDTRIFKVVKNKF